MKVDIAKYILGNCFGGVVADLDVVPQKPLSRIVTENSPYFDKCSRKNFVANDFFYVPAGGLPSILEECRSNVDELSKKEIYRTWKYRYVLRSTGPDFLTKYVKRHALLDRVFGLSSRLFLDPRQTERNVERDGAPLIVYHTASWKPQLQIKQK